VPFFQEWYASSFSLQITQQPLQRLLVVVMLLPPGEITDMSGALDVRRPRLGSLHHRIIEANREKDQLSLLLFFFKRCRCLAFHPGTR
jgi:hypothetical protein